MPESTIISIPSTVPLSERIAEVHKGISDWLKSLDKPFNYQWDALRLTKYDRDGNNYCYQYVIDRGISVSGASKSV